MRIRKKEPSVGILGKIVNSFTNSKNDTYSADYVNKIPMKVLENDTNIDNIRENGRFAIFNAKGTLPNGYSTNDNNIFIDSYLFGTDYGRQILHDVRTNKSFSRNLSNGVWQGWSSNDYSTEETFTGKYWIDGKKIYRKIMFRTITANEANGDLYPNLQTGLMNVDFMMFKGFVIYGDTSTYCRDLTSMYEFYFDKPTGRIVFILPKQAGNATIIMEYTKITE